MKKRQILIVIGVLILIGAVVAAYFMMSSGKEEKTRAEQQMPAEQSVAVEVMEVENEAIQTYIHLTGRLQPEDKIDIYSEVGGVMRGTGKPFKEGVRYANFSFL